MNAWLRFIGDGWGALGVHVALAVIGGHIGDGGDGVGVSGDVDGLVSVVGVIGLAPLGSLGSCTLVPRKAQRLELQTTVNDPELEVPAAVSRTTR